MKPDFSSHRLPALLFIFFTVGFFSCAGYQFIPESRVVRDYHTCFSNDSLKIALKLYGPDHIRTEKLSRRDKRVLKALQLNKGSAVLLFSGCNFFDGREWYLMGVSRQDMEINLSEDYQEAVYDKTSSSMTHHTLHRQKKSPYYYRKIKYRNQHIVEALVPLDDRYLSLIVYTPDSGEEENILANMDGYVQMIAAGEEYQECIPAGPSKIADEAFGSSGEGNYLLPVIRLKENEDNYNGVQEKAIFYQMLATYYSLYNELDSARGSWEKLYNLYDGKSFNPEDTIKKYSLYFKPAKEEILELAAKHQVIMFNEAHTEPKGRYLAGTLLEDLYKLGYRYLALEALSEDDTVGHRGFPAINSGLYTREPTMANLLRYALKIGFIPVSYDEFSSQREIMQARNIYRKTLEKNPESKVVVLAGHDHINESSGGNRKMMAAHFREISGIDPVTINQTRLEGYAPAVGKEGAFSLKQREVKWAGMPEGQNDLYILNTFNIKTKGNGFAPQENKRIIIDLPADSLLQDDAHLLLIYKQEELVINNPVPVLMKLVRDKRLPLQFLLRPGNYIIKIKDSMAQVLWEKELVVE